MSAGVTRAMLTLSALLLLPAAATTILLLLPSQILVPIPVVDRHQLSAGTYKGRQLSTALRTAPNAHLVLVAADQPSLVPARVDRVLNVVRMQPALPHDRVRRGLTPQRKCSSTLHMHMHQ